MCRLAILPLLEKPFNLCPALLGLIVLLLLLSTTVAGAQPTPEQRCQAGKNQAAGKYALCRQEAEGKLATTGDSAKYAESVSRCADKFAYTWQKLEAKAGVPCPDEPLDQSTFETVIDQCSANVATALGGSGLSDCSESLATCEGELGTCTADNTTCQDGLGTCLTDKTTCQTSLGTCQGDRATCESDLGTAQACGNNLIDVGEACDQGNLNGQTCAMLGFVAGGTLACGAGCALDTSGCIATRFVDNGDGTVMDHLTGLQWEGKTGSQGSLLDCSANPCPDPHNVNNVYSWSISGNVPDGGVYTDFLGQLNACQDDGNGISPPTGLTGGFADHCDWRLPTIIELESLMLGQYPCGINPCLDSAFSPTGVGQGYWSSSTRATRPDIAWAVFFRDGWIGFADPKIGTKYVRAVRNGS